MHIHSSIVGVCLVHYDQVQCKIILPLLEDDFKQAANLGALAMRNSAASMLIVQPCAGRVPCHNFTAGACFSFDPVAELGFHTVGTLQSNIQHTIASTGILWALFVLLRRTFALTAFPFLERAPNRIWA
jgi:hypothetical protein